MKNFLKLFGLITLICFSFFYTEKVMLVVSEQDPLKIEINNLKEKYQLNPIEAITTNDTIIPGINGRMVNVEKSYKKMKKNNIFNKNLLVYDPIYPKQTLSNNLDKYIIKGNNRNNVSILFIVTNDNNLNRIINILNNKNIIGNFFVDFNYLNNNISKIKNYSNHNLYSYEDDYSYEKLIISNNIIKRIANNNPIYCLTKEKNNNNLNVCSYSKMSTVIPSINGSLNDIKTNLENGSIILLDNNTYELSYIIDFILGKGYNIVSLNDLLSEK